MWEWEWEPRWVLVEGDRAEIEPRSYQPKANAFIPVPSTRELGLHAAHAARRVATVAAQAAVAAVAASRRGGGGAKQADEAGIERPEEL